MIEMKMAIPTTKYILWFTALVVIMACVPTVAAPSIPTTDPNAISTYIAQTANAAVAQTAAAMPTNTSTATFTTTPRNTDTPEPTATATVIFRFFTATSIAPTTSSQSYACDILSVTPANGTTFGSRTAFDAVWLVKNNGKKEWDKSTVDYAYLNGDKFHKVAAYDLTTTVARGDTTLLDVAMQAPKKTGTYTTNWTLRVGAETFCPMSLTIVVK
jgi:hypothetical protein